MQSFNAKARTFALLPILLIVFKCQEVGANCENNQFYKYLICLYDKPDRRPIVIGIGIAIIFFVLLIVFLIPFFLCYFGRCCCFRGRNKPSWKNLARNMAYVECPQGPPDAQEEFSSSMDVVVDDGFGRSTGPSVCVPGSFLEPEPISAARHHQQISRSRSVNRTRYPHQIRGDGRGGVDPQLPPYFENNRPSQGPSAQHLPTMGTDEDFESFYSFMARFSNEPPPPYSFILT